MKAGGDPAGAVRRNTFVEGCGEAEEISPREVLNPDNPTSDGQVAQGKLRQIEDGRPYFFAITESVGGFGANPTPLSDGAARSIAQKIGQTAEWVQARAATARGMAEIHEALARAKPVSSGGCGGGGSTARTTGGGSNGSGGGQGVTESSRVMVLDLMLVLGLIAWRVATMEAAAASVFLGAAFPPPPEA